MIKNKQKGFALVLSLVLLLVMSLMGGGLVVIASSDHEGNNSSDHYQQTFYVAETALMQAEKSLVDKMMGPIDITDSNGNRLRDKDIFHEMGMEITMELMIQLQYRHPVIKVLEIYLGKHLLE